MQEEAYNRVRADCYGSFTYTSRRSFDALLRRLEEYDAEYIATVHTHGATPQETSRYEGQQGDFDDLVGSFDTAIVRVHEDDLRPLRYLIKT